MASRQLQCDNSVVFGLSWSFCGRTNLENHDGLRSAYQLTNRRQPQRKLTLGQASFTTGGLAQNRTAGWAENNGLGVAEDSANVQAA